MIWAALEAEKPTSGRLLYRRYSGEIQPDVYVALKFPEGFRSVAAHVTSGLELNAYKWDELRDIRIETLPDEKNGAKQFLLVMLLNKQHQDIFSSLSEDLLHQIAEIKQEDKLIEVLMLRLEKWRLLFEKVGKPGLSDEAQRGLYGELYFLRKFLENLTKAEYCINSWKGSERAVQDFHYSDWAVEVKTTHGKNQQKLHISNERQLDISLVPRIFLVHLSLDVRQNHGETLNDVIDELRESLSDSPAALSSFRLKLLEAGYFDVHKHYYAETGYSIRQENLYRITDDFPKITESDVPQGVGDVRYSLIVGANEDWLTDYENLFHQLYSNE